MRIKLCNLDRKPLFAVTCDPDEPPGLVREAGGEREVHLDWEQALDEAHRLRQCPVCGCGELFARRDFPQAVGFGIVVVAATVATVLFAMGLLVASVSVLAAVVVVDGVIAFFTGRCLVCYRCRSEFRDIPIAKDHPGWDLATGEKYRPIEPSEFDEPSGGDEAAGS